MKKTLYIAAALMAVVGCSKSELAPETVGTHDINVSVAVSTGADTKAVFDGDSHIKFEKGDRFYAAIAKKSDPTTGVKVATQAGYAAKVYYSTFRINDAEAESPVFDGSIYSIPESNFSEEYCFYGVFPSNAVNVNFSEDDLTSWYVKLPKDQTATQEHWDAVSDVMLVKPTTISTSKSTFDEEYKEYSTTQNEKLQFAHLFGFGKITFAGVPEVYAKQIVKSVKIEAIGENKVISGNFYVDITKDVEDVVPVPATKYSEINLAGDGQTTVADYVAWFVANPGTFDVKITVATNKADLVFERQGLVINRSVITAPVVNYKSADVVESHDVVLVDGENWTNTITTSNYIYNKEKAWGNGDKKMLFSLSYPGSANSNTGSYLSDNGKYVQKLASSNIQGGKVVLSSAAEFCGMKEIMANLGMYTNDVTADFTVSVVKDGKTYNLGKIVGVSGSNKNVDGKNYYFKTTSESESGQLVVTVDNLSNTNCSPYLGTLSINPAPEIAVEKSVKVNKTAHSEDIDCAVYAAQSEPTVTVSDDAKDWLSTKWSENKLTLTVAENTGKKRVGTITVKANGWSETTETITVTQESATIAKYKLSVTAADMYKFLKSEADRLTAEGKEVDKFTGYPVTAKFTAVGVDDPTKTTEVEIYGDKLYIGSATEDAFKSRGALKCTSEVGAITEIKVVADKKVGSNFFADLTIQLSSNGASWSKATSFNVEGSNPYTSSVTIDDESITWFNIAVTGQTTQIYSFEVTFTAD